MSTDTVETLLAILRRTQLLGEEQVDEIARELTPVYADPLALGEYLVQIDWLTAYQLRLLLSGEWRELTVGPYQILGRLGEGGISEVFKAWDTLRGRVVALKVLRQDLTGKPDVVRQFQRELQVATQLSHPNVIRTLDSHQEGHLHYFAMEFFEGMDLDRYVQQVGPLPVEQAIDYTRQVAQALQHAHQNGLVHRDIKPANLFLVHPPPKGNGTGGRRGFDPAVKVIDWGLAHAVRDPVAPPSAGAGETEAEKGVLVGTADYVAPEQARDPTRVDIRADIYSLGCSLYYLLTGHPPFPTTGLMQKLHHHQTAPPPSVLGERPDVPAELDGLLLKMLEKNPEDRPRIPLMVVASLRQLAGRPLANGVLTCSAGPPGGCLRPGSSADLSAPLSGPSTAVNLRRPDTKGMLTRPGTHPNLPQAGRNGTHR